jgi:hypothetical protein
MPGENNGEGGAVLRRGAPASPPEVMKEPMTGEGEKGGAAGTRSGLELVEGLRRAYGWKLLAMLAASQWCIKGIVWGLTLSGMDFLLRDYGVSGPRMQVYKAITMLPWAMKPLFGLVSDACPILGYRKAPYIILVTILAIFGHVTIGMSPHHELNIKVVVACLVLACAQASVVDLLTEAAYAEKIRLVPERGPDLMTYVWAGITLGNLVATGSVGFIITHYGSSSVYAIVALPCCLVLAPTCMNWLEEKRLTPEEAAAHRAKLWEQRELLFLVMITGCATFTLVAVGLLQDCIYVNFAVALTVGAIVMTAFMMLLRPMIGKMNTFFFIQTCCVVDISGASFYFFTDNAEQYPGGPNFSKIFFASVLGVFVAILNLFGMWIYNRTMQHWKYHSLFIFANLLLFVVNLLGLLVYARINVSLGMPDALFVLGSWGAYGIVHMWMWLPGVVLLSHLCPAGCEATMYALLAGCHNLGLSVASYAGACLLDSLGVTPRGAVNEGHTFDNLWIAGLVQAVMPVVTLVMLPWMIPNTLQTEKLLEPGASAIEGSPWERLVGARRKPMTEAEAEAASYGAAQ